MEQPIRFFEGRFGRLKLLQSGETAEPASHTDVQVLALVTGPELRCSTGDGEAVISRDGLLLVNPGVPLSVSGGEGSRYVLYQGVQEWLGWSFPAVFGPGLGTPFPHLREDIKPRIRRLIDTLDVEMRNDRFLSPNRLEFMAQELVLSIVEGYLVRRRPAAALWHGSRFADTRIRNAIALLRAKPNKELNMDVVANKVGLSRSRFYDLFQFCTGLSPREYLDQLCVETAIARLASAGTKIAEVSADLGFSAQSNFTRFFLHQIGVPPSEYRRAVLRNVDAAT